MQHHDRLIVHIKVSLVARIRIGWPAIGRNLCFSDLSHESKEIIMAKQHRLIWPSSQTWPSLIDKACLHQRTISSRVVVRERRINDGADGFFGNLPDCRESLGAHLLVAGVD